MKQRVIVKRKNIIQLFEAQDAGSYGIGKTELVLHEGLIYKALEKEIYANEEPGSEEGVDSWRIFKNIPEKDGAFYRVNIKGNVELDKEDSTALIVVMKGGSITLPDEWGMKHKSIKILNESGGSVQILRKNSKQKIENWEGDIEIKDKAYMKATIEDGNWTLKSVENIKIQAGLLMIGIQVGTKNIEVDAIPFSILNEFDISKYWMEVNGEKFENAIAWIERELEVTIWK